MRLIGTEGSRSTISRINEETVSLRSVAALGPSRRWGVGSGVRERAAGLGREHDGVADEGGRRRRGGVDSVINETTGRRFRGTRHGAVVSWLRGIPIGGRRFSTISKIKNC